MRGDGDEEKGGERGSEKGWCWVLELARGREKSKKRYIVRAGEGERERLIENEIIP